MLPISSSFTSSNDAIPSVLFLGAGSVGKTSIIHRFLHNKFSEKYQATVEDLYVKTFEVTNQDVVVQLEIIDTSGSFDFPAMRKLRIKAAKVFVLVFAQNDIPSFMKMKELFEEIVGLRSDILQTLPFIVVCNKTDLPITEDMFSDGSVEVWMAEVGLSTNQFIYTSAKQTPKSIDQLFAKLWKQNCQLQTIPLRCISTNKMVLPERRNSAVVGYSVYDSAIPDYIQNPEPNNNVTKSDGGQALMASHATERTFSNRFGSSRRRILKKNKQKTTSDTMKLECTIS